MIPAKGQVGVLLEWLRSRVNYIAAGDSNDIGVVGLVFPHGAEAESADARIEFEARESGG
jgi:hypothetical protein